MAGKPELRPFATVLRDLLIERDIVTGMGNPNWPAFTEMMDGVHYETLRQAVSGARKPTPRLMEAAAEALGLDPVELFYEYALYNWRRQFDPDEVGDEVALKNFNDWASRRKK
jgi:hypothetical protein